jgi:hypothetical protein
MKMYALRNGLGSRFSSPRFGLAVGREMEWKYRGQILPTHKDMKLEVAITEIVDGGKTVTVSGNASLWADTVRIYEIKNAAISISDAA